MSSVNVEKGSGNTGWTNDIEEIERHSDREREKKVWMEMGSKDRKRLTALRVASAVGILTTGYLIVRMLFPVLLQVLPLGGDASSRFRNLPQVEYYDLSNYQGNANGWQMGDRVLFCVPLRDAAEHLPMFFDHMDKMTYPHNLIDLSFLVSDSSDDTMGVLLSRLGKAQSNQDKTKRFGNIEIFEKDFGQIIGQSFSDRHGFAAQGPRRKLMARARNWLGSVALKPYHSYVYWRDVDVKTIPRTILEDLMHHDKDVIVPNVWRPLPDWLGNIQPYDLNSWVESEGGLQLADSLGEDACIVEGYPEYATWRTHLAYMRDPSGDPEVEMELDGIGGVSILSKAKVFRTGSHFPAFSFEKHAETEAFGKLAFAQNEVQCGGAPPLRDLAYLRTVERRFETHGVDGRRGEEAG